MVVEMKERRSEIASTCSLICIDTPPLPGVGGYSHNLYTYMGPSFAD